jgi:hypothetical protein
MYMRPEPLEVHPAGFIRRRCRNPRCSARLKQETDNPRDAFCCVGCFDQSYRTIDAIKALRRGLKYLLRHCGLRCLSIQEQDHE